MLCVVKIKYFILINVKFKLGILYFMFNSQGHLGTGQQTLHLLESNPYRDDRNYDAMLAI